MNYKNKLSSIILFTIWGLLTILILTLIWFHFSWSYFGVTKGIPESIISSYETSWDALTFFFTRNYGTGGLIYVVVGASYWWLTSKALLYLLTKYRDKKQQEN
jgi:hypothetical protein